VTRAALIFVLLSGSALAAESIDVKRSRAPDDHICRVGDVIVIARCGPWSLIGCEGFQGPENGFVCEGGVPRPQSAPLAVRSAAPVVEERESVTVVHPAPIVRHHSFHRRPQPKSLLDVLSHAFQ
jgi:hypothetical protein